MPLGHALIAIALATTACAPSSEPAPPATAGASTTAPSTGTPPSSAGLILLALRDNGSTLSVPRGSRITLSLPSTHRWSTPVFSGAHATATEVVSDAPAGGPIFEITAHEAGRSTLRSTGRPACAPGPQCAATELSYEVVLDVRS